MNSYAHPNNQLQHDTNRPTEEDTMTTIQPSNDQTATLYAIAWDIVQPYIAANSAAFSPEEIGSLLFYTVAAMTENPLSRMTENPAPFMRRKKNGEEGLLDT